MTAGDSEVFVRECVQQDVVISYGDLFQCLRNRAMLLAIERVLPRLTVGTSVYMYRLPGKGRVSLANLRV